MRSPGTYLLIIVAVFVCVGNPAGADNDRIAVSDQSAEIEQGAKSAARQPASNKLTRTQRREASQVVSHFRRARGKLAKQVQAVQEAMSAGPHAASALFSVIRQQIRPQLERYRNKFRERAAAISSRQVGKVNLEEVARLRQTVLSLQHNENFSKELIVQRGDPAMRRLAEMFLVNRAAVLNSSKALQAERRKLQALGQLWEQLAVYLCRFLPDDGKPEKPPSFERYLRGEEELAVGLAAPMDNATRNVLAANAQLAGKLDPEEARAILAFNLTRNLLGLPPCAIDLKLCAAARDHSDDMKTKKFFAHESPVPGKKTPWDRAKRFGTSASAENIAVGYQDGQAANLGWFHSPGHHVNMLDKHKRVGIGRSGAHYTEMFGR